MLNRSLRTELGVWAQHIRSMAGHLGIGGEKVERIVRQEVMELEVGNASIGLISHRVQIHVARQVSPSLVLHKESVGEKAGGLTHSGVGMEHHLGEMNLVKAKVSVDATEIHRRDVPFQVGTEGSAVGQVLERTRSTDIYHSGHGQGEGLQRETIHIA